MKNQFFWRIPLLVLTAFLCYFLFFSIGNATTDQANIIILVGFIVSLSLFAWQMNSLERYAFGWYIIKKHVNQDKFFEELKRESVIKAYNHKLIQFQNTGRLVRDAPFQRIYTEIGAMYGYSSEEVKAIIIKYKVGLIA